MLVRYARPLFHSLECRVRRLECAFGAHRHSDAHVMMRNARMAAGNRTTMRSINVARGMATLSARQRSRDAALYISAAVVALGSAVYASVPLYRIFCQQTGFAGTPKEVRGKTELPKPVAGAQSVRVCFEAEVGDSLPWSFVPEIRSITVVPGQTALAFFRARNAGDKSITGVATYNIVPAKAARYFNKIQCFCFENQCLGPGEEVDMPVFFYLDPEYALDPSLDRVSDIVLGYTFFETKE